MNLELFLAGLQGVRRNGRGWQARCPAHEDKNPSLSIHERERKILLHCHAGCTVEAVCAAAGIEMRELFSDNAFQPRIVAEYDYRDERGELLYQVVRFEPKDFRPRRPDGNGGSVWNLNGTRRVLYRLPEVLTAKSVLVCEGEKDCEAARALSIVATCNVGGAGGGKWREEYSECLRGRRVAVIADADEPGRKHAQQVAASLHGKAESVKLLELPGAKDLTEWVERGGTREALLELIRNTPEWKAQGVSSTGNENHVNPWSLAAGMDTFLSAEDEPVAFLYEPIISKGAITEIFAPRGLGKSLWAHAVAVSLALKGYRVLLIDRDNPKREVRARLRGFGATSELKGLKVISREHAPSLTNRQAWAEFPYAEYDFVVLDSFDSAAEGVGEQDSTKPSLALAPLLDIARREDGPAVLVLGNTVRNGAHSRGSGVIEDRADIVCEVRDATNFKPSGQKPWIEELPAADAGSWAGRSTRRKRLTKYRLAFIPTKFRIGEEPEPFIIEINLESDPWTISDVTDDVDRAGQAERERQVQERAAAIDSAAQSLKAEILRREAAGEPVMLKTQAVKFLTSPNIKRKLAREVIDLPIFKSIEIGGKGHPNGIRLVGIKDNLGRNSIPTEAAPDAGYSYGDFCRPHPEPTAEIPPDKTLYPCGSQNILISAEPTLYTPSEGTETAAPERLDGPDTDPDGEIRL